MSAPRVGDMIAGRYRVLAELGAGATCRVLRVRDESGPRREDDPAASSRAGDVVALKLFAPQMVEGTLEGRVRFRREARVLSALSHPSIVRILGLGEHERAPYLTMELIDGGTLESLLAARIASGQPPLAEAEVVRILIELARGLAFAHSRGITHRDLKPANVLLRAGQTGETLPTIADFGVAQLGEAREGDKGWVIGTPGYMAPEQCHVVDGGVDERSDLFALGVVGYELATGERPFRAETLAVYIRELATRSPAPPSRRRESLSAMLEAVILRLLARAPNARYQTAQGALHDLERLARQERAVVFELGTRDLRGTVGARTTLVGRGEVSQLLGDAWARAASGAGEVIVLEAPSGIGKTRLVEDLAPHIAARRGVLLRGKNYEFEAPSPFRTLTEAVRDLLTQDEGNASPSAGVERLRLALRDLDDVILRVVPELEQLLGAPRPRALAPHDQELLRVREAYVRLFQALSSLDHPLAIFLDDLQWSDEDALEVVRQLARELAGHPILLILACRERDAPTSARRADKGGGLSGLLGSLDGRATFLALSPLDHPEIAALVLGMLDGAPPEVVRLVAEHVAIRAAGNPLFVEEQVRGLVADGIVTFATGVGWRCDQPRLAATDPPNNVVEVIVARASRLRADVKAVVETAAIVGRQVPFEMLRELCPDLPVETLVESLDEAVRAYLLTRTPTGDYAFTCDRALQALYEGMTPEARERMHVSLCHRLEALRARGRVVPAADLSRHARAMGDQERALRYGVEAARDAWAVHAYLVASRFYEDALALATGPVRDEIRVELAETLVVIGRYAEAVRTVTRALDTTDPGTSRVRLLRVVAAAQFALGRYPEATLALEAALSAEGIPVARTRLATGVSLTRTLVGLATDAMKRAVRRRALSPAPPSSARTSSFSSDEVGVIDTLGRLYFFTDMWKFVDVSLFGYRRLRDATDPGARLYAYASHAVFCQILGLSTRAAIFADQARELEHEASLLQLARGLPVIALYDQLRHDLARGLPAARRAEEACVRAGDLWSLCVALDMQASMLLAKGDLVGAGRSADRFLALVEQHDVRQRRARALLLSSYMAFLLGRVDGPSCEAELARARVDSQQMGDELTAAAVAWMHADVVLASGDVERALPLAEEGVALVRKQRRLHPDALLAVSTLVRVLARHHHGKAISRAEKRRFVALADDAVKWGERFPGLLGPGLGARALAEMVVAPTSQRASATWDAAHRRMSDTDDLVRLAALRIDRALLCGETNGGPHFDDAREAVQLLDALAAKGAARYGRIALSLEPLGMAMTTRPVAGMVLPGVASPRAITKVTERVPVSAVLTTGDVARLFEADEEAEGDLATLRSAASDRER